MKASAHHPANRRRHSSVWAILASVLLLTLSTASFGQAHSQPALFNSPSLQAAVVAPRLDTVTVHGQGFTPGGLVQITISGSARAELDRQLWTVASTEVFTPQSSIDPWWGFTPAGTIDEAIAVDPDVVYGENGSQDPARGYDDRSTSADSDVIYGENGSQDPASGYVDPSTDQQERARVPLCFQDFTVQAFDVQSGATSSLVEVHATCSTSAGLPTAQTAPDIAQAQVCVEGHTCELPY